ncbi:MAG: class I SAM-dependent methyltransferase [bacterium]|nr:class I SAM-dependent methyltransferase [bacterium]
MVVLTLIILYFFSSKASPIPYFPTNSQDMPMIVKAMKLANNQVIIDLGAGDGAVVWAAATSAYEKGLNTQFVAVDINIVLVLWMKFRRLVHPHKAHISIIHGDMFLLNYKKIIGSKKPLFYLYIAPWFTKQVHKMIQELNIPCTILSYFYPITSGKSQKTAHRVHELYFYTIR